jgi:RNA polymerase sigma-70 factor (ECF subfamily)
MSEQKTDQELVEQVQKGNKNAFNFLVIRHQNKVMNIVARYVKNSGDVADVTQEAFIKAYRALPNFRGESAFYTWLYRIAVNSAKNYLTSQRRKPQASDVDASEADYYDGSDALKENNSPEKNLMSEQMEKLLFDAMENCLKIYVWLLVYVN